MSKRSDIMVSQMTQMQIDKDIADQQSEFVKEYNNEIREGIIDGKYSKESLGLLNGNVLVRLFKEPYFKDEKLGIVNVSTFSVPSPSGNKMVTKSDPLPYQNKGLIVNLDPNLEERVSYGVGDFVQITENIIYTRFAGEIPQIQHMFMRVGDKDFNGYVLIPSREIMCILKDIKNESKND